MSKSLRWFGAWEKTGWEVGYKARREAYAYGRGGRYQIERTHEYFVVRYQRPYVDFFDDIGTAATQEEAIALAQAHNDAARKPTTRPEQAAEHVQAWLNRPDGWRKGNAARRAEIEAIALAQAPNDQAEDDAVCSPRERA